MNGNFRKTLERKFSWHICNIFEHNQRLVLH